MHTHSIGIVHSSTFRRVSMVCALLAAFRVSPHTWTPVVAQQQPANLSITVEGRQIPWVMRGAPLWIGGNFYQLDRLAKSGSVDFLQQIIEDLRDQARNKEALLTHVMDLREFARKELRKDSHLTVFYGEDNVVDRLKKNPVDAWQAFTQAFIQPLYPEDAKIEILVSKSPAPTGGFPTQHAIFEIETAEGARFRSVAHLVDLGSRGTHMFVMNTDETKFAARYPELRDMLASVRYNFR